MLYFALGLVVLILTLMALKGFARASPAVLARQLRIVAGSSALAGAAVLGVRGAITYAVPLAMFGSWLIWGRAVPWAGFPGGGRRTAGQASRITTDWLELELDHDTGALRGRVLAGGFAGRSIESLTATELATLWGECRFSDPRSAQLVEAYLDRTHPNWREDTGSTAHSPPGHAPRMSSAEASEILGLEPGASEEEIRRAHRELMLKLHPDRGGSDYLAAKINEAKSVLLGK